MEIGFENSALETRQRRTERTQYKMQIPENYGYVVLAIAAMGIPNVVAVVRVIKATNGKERHRERDCIPHKHIKAT